MTLPLAIQQGAVYWIAAEALRPFVPGVSHPHVVVQADVLNQTRIPTTVVCGLSSNLKRAEEPGNVLLDSGEGNLAHASVVVVSQISVVDKSDLVSPIGLLRQSRVEQILDGLLFLQKSFYQP